nr:MAG TPA: protein of unknown function (DUF5474) [Caudoviricetes sp.]
MDTSFSLVLYYVFIIPPIRWYCQHFFKFFS